MSANAEKVVFISDGAQVFYDGDATEQVVVPIGFDALNDGGTLVCSAGQLKWTDPSSFACRNSAIRWADNKEAVFTATAGVKITKMTTYSQTGAVGLFGGWTVDAIDARKLTYTPESPVESVTMTPATQNRLEWFEIEYSGEATQVFPAIATSFDLAQPGELTFKSATEGATTYYTTDGTDPTTESAVATDGKVKFTGNVVIKTLAAKEGMTSSFIYQQPAMAAAEGSTIAAFLFPQPFTMDYLKEGKATAVTEDLFQADGNNKKWDFGPTATSPDVPVVTFVSEDASMTMEGGAKTIARFYWSSTFGGNYEARIYQGNNVSFMVPEGYVITDVIFNTVDSQTAGLLSLGSSEIVNGVCKITKDEDQSALTQFDKYSKWNFHYVAPAEGTQKVQIVVTENKTVYFDNAFICYKKVAEEGGSAVAEVEVAEDAPVEYYNLQGVRVANPENGIFIVKQGNKVSKKIFK